MTTAEVLKRTSLNLFLNDTKALEKLYGYAWSAQVRHIVRRWLKERERLNEQLAAQAEDME